MSRSQNSSSSSSSLGAPTRQASGLAPTIIKKENNDEDDDDAEVHPYHVSREYTQKVLNQLSHLFIRLSFDFHEYYHEHNRYKVEGDQLRNIISRRPTTKSGLFGINLAQYPTYELMEHRKYHHPNSFNTILHMHNDAIGYEGPIR